MLSDKPFQPGDQPRVLTDGQPGLGERSFGLQPQACQVFRLLLKPGRPCHVGQRWAPPQRHRGRQMLHLLVAIRRTPSQLDEALGGLDVSGIRPAVEHVTGLARHDRPGLAEHPA